MAQPTEVRRWLEYADEDLAYGPHGITVFPRAAAWSFQQAAEKASKACLIAEAKVPPRTHDLVLLLNLVAPNPSPELKGAVLKLAEITASSRYPDDMEPISVSLAAEYAAAAKAVLQIAKAGLVASS